MGSLNSSDIVDGRVYAEITGGGDTFAWGFNLLASVVAQAELYAATEDDPDYYNDGAVRVEEALGIDPYGFVDLDPDPNLDGYPEPIRAVVPESCAEYLEPPPGPYTDKGLYLNHHQLRKGSAWYYKICSPTWTTFCAPTTMITWLKYL
jgi:hypothetical protein